MIIEYKGMKPKTEEAVFVAENATLIGNVELKKDSNIWFGAVLRGDNNKIVVGERSNIQDNCTLHCDANHEMIVGNDVTVGHNVVLHGCNIGDGCLIGMGAIIMNGVVLGKNCIVGAGALITEGKEFPDNSLIIGSPAKLKTTMPEEHAEVNLKSAAGYVERGRSYVAL